jgi:hypothetical protein
LKNFLSTLFLLTSLTLSSQTIYVGQPAFADLPRMAQLQGKLDKAYSFTVMPVVPFDSMKSFLANQGGLEAPFSHRPPSIVYRLLPITFQSKFNSHHPYGWNDGGMIMAKGLQTQLSAGLYARVGPLTIQLRPEFVWAANSRYDTSASYGAIPNGSFGKIYGGQSSIFLNALGLGIGVSTENLWWGPGQFSSLLMSNNAPGFPHIRFQTNKPLKTPIGSFEWQIIAARLSEDTTKPNENNFNRPLLPKNDWRYLNGIVISWQPSFIKNFFIGATASQQLYGSDFEKNRGGFFKKYFPVFTPPSPTQNAQANQVPTDGQFSFFSRALFPKHRAEFYIEYGYNDYKQNFRDLAANPSHSAAWIIGMKKIVELKSKRVNTVNGLPSPVYLDFSAELTQMAQTTSAILRSAGNWYTHSPISQGLTFQNQILGAGSGMGNNVQTIQVRKITDLDIIGIKLQRIQQDPRGLDPLRISTIGMREFAWTDISLGFMGQKKWNKIIAGGELQLVSSKNYAWRNANAFNIFLTTHISYFF